MQHLSDIQRVSGQPGFKAGSRQQVVQTQGQLETLLGGIKRLQIHHTDALQRRLLDGSDEPRKVQPPAGTPGLLEDVGYQDVLSVDDRIRIAPHQGQQSGNRRLDPLPEEVGVRSRLRRRWSETAQNIDRQTGAASRSVDSEIGGCAQPGDSLRPLVPFRQPLAPHVRCFFGELVQTPPLAGGVAGLNPGSEVFGTQIGKTEKQVGDIPFGIDGDHRNIVDQRFLQQPDPQAGLAAAGHADDNGMGQKVFGIIKDQFISPLPGRHIKGFSQVENTQFFVSFHRKPPLNDGTVHGAAAGCKANRPGTGLASALLGEPVHKNG